MLSWLFNGETCCPCENGFKMTLDINLVPNGQKSVSEDWEVDVRAYTGPVNNSPVSSSNVGFGLLSGGTLDEADITPVSKPGSQAGNFQIPASHEFGHALGLSHPGDGISGAHPYTHVGQDQYGNNVDGTADLMGAGNDLRPFYFNKWKEKINDRHPCKYEIN